VLLLQSVSTSTLRYLVVPNYVRTSVQDNETFGVFGGRVKLGGEPNTYHGSWVLPVHRSVLLDIFCMMFTRFDGRSPLDSVVYIEKANATDFFGERFNEYHSSVSMIAISKALLFASWTQLALSSSRSTSLGSCYYAQ
jgi:hypothetical protein